MLKKYLFLAAELILYVLLLTTGGDLAIYSSFGAIMLCFLYGLFSEKPGLLKLGLLFTVFADFCLVICSPRQQLWGMVFFLVVQSLYACYLHTKKKSGVMLLVRLLLIAAVEAAALLVLKNNADLLALISVCYYVLLVTNMIHAFLSKDLHLGIAFCLFMLCDTVIGLQEASTGYLPIGENTLLYKLLFVDFNLAWVFYLPSQVLIALKTKKV